MTEQQLQLLVEQISINAFSRPFKHKALFNKRLKTTGGRYLLNSHNIEINEKMYIHFGLEELKGIILHELCHYHLHIEGKGYKHQDKDFKQLLKATGAPRFCSTLPKEEKAVIKVRRYTCIECHYIYNRKRRVNVMKYRCGKCSGRLIMIENVD